MITVNVDTSKAQAKMRGLLAGSQASRLAAVKEMTRTVLKNIETIAPRDTNRYVRGWMQAGNAAGLGPFMIPPLNRASNLNHILESIAQQRDYWEYIVDRYHHQGRHDSWAAKAERRLAQAQEQVDKFVQSNEGAVIAINLYSNYTMKGKAIRVLNKVYGGTGKVIDRPDATFVQLHNREPHTSIVEKNKKVLNRASQMFRSSGLARVKGKYLERALQAANGGGAAIVSGQ